MNRRPSRRRRRRLAPPAAPSAGPPTAWPPPPPRRPARLVSETARTYSRTAVQTNGRNHLGSTIINGRNHLGFDPCSAGRRSLQRLHAPRNQRDDATAARPSLAPHLFGCAVPCAADPCNAFMNCSTCTSGEAPCGWSCRPQTIRSCSRRRAPISLLLLLLPLLLLPPPSPRHHRPPPPTRCTTPVEYKGASPVAEPFHCAGFDPKVRRPTKRYKWPCSPRILASNGRVHLGSRSKRPCSPPRVPVLHTDRARIAVVEVQRRVPPRTVQGSPQLHPT